MVNNGSSSGNGRKWGGWWWSGVLGGIAQKCVALLVDLGTRFIMILGWILRMSLCFSPQLLSSLFGALIFCYGNFKKITFFSAFIIVTTIISQKKKNVFASNTFLRYFLFKTCTSSKMLPLRSLWILYLLFYVSSSFFPKISFIKIFFFFL